MPSILAGITTALAIVIGIVSGGFLVSKPIEKNLAALTNTVSSNQTFGGLGGLIARPYIITTDPSVTTSTATSTQWLGSSIPFNNNQFDLGVPTQAWRNLFIAGSVKTSSTEFSGNLLPDNNNKRDVGSATLSWHNLYVSSSAYFGGPLIPYQNNLVDLGAATSSFRDVYASGTVYTSLILVGNGTAGAPTYSFLNDTDTGIYRAGANDVALAGGGSVKFLVGASGAIFYTTFAPGSANAYNMGNFNLSWKDIFSSGTIYNVPAALGATGNLICAGTNGAYQSQALNCTVSSLRFKHDIEPLKVSGLKTVLALKPVSYERNQDNVPEYGLIAEDVEKIDPMLVIHDDQNRPKSVKYEQFITTLLIKAVQEQQTQIDELKKEVKKLKK